MEAAVFACVPASKWRSFHHLHCPPTCLPLPAGKVTWVLDKASASELRVADWAAGSKKFPRSEGPTAAAAEPAAA